MESHRVPVGRHVVSLCTLFHRALTRVFRRFTGGIGATGARRAAAIGVGIVLSLTFGTSALAVGDECDGIDHVEVAASTTAPGVPTIKRCIDRATQIRVAAAFGNLPIAFEANQGQTDAKVRFLARGQGYGLFLTPTEAVLSLGGQAPEKVAGAVPAASRNAVVRMRLSGAERNPRVDGIDPLPGSSNYFIGNDPSKWRTSVPNYAKVKYSAVYPGIDLVYYGNQRQLEYDFVIAPGANPKRIALKFAGVRKLAIDGDGSLALVTANGVLKQHKPVAYQERDGVRYAIDARYVLYGKLRAGFEVARYDVRRSLVIDPTLTYSTYLGGSTGDAGSAIAADNNGVVYVTGTAGSTDFPVTASAYQTMNKIGVYGTVFVTKLNTKVGGPPALLYSTYLGGTGFGGAGVSRGKGVAVDGNGNIYVVGHTEATDFPTTPNAFQTVCTGYSAFVAKLNPNLSGAASLVYSTCLGDSSVGNAIAVGGSGNAYVTGYTLSTNFPTTPGAYQTTNTGSGLTAFVSELNPSASGSASLAYSTYLGGSAQGNGIAVDNTGFVYLTGQTGPDLPTVNAYQPTSNSTGTAFVAKLNPSVSGAAALVYSSYLGGALLDVGTAIAADNSGNAYVTGYANSLDFPTTPGAYQKTNKGVPPPLPGFTVSNAFVAKLRTNISGIASLAYSTYLGGSCTQFGDQGNGIAVDANGNAYLAGQTCSSDFPVTAGAPQTSFGGGGNDPFVAKLNPSASGIASLVYSTYLGGNGDDVAYGIAVDASGIAYVAGVTNSRNFPMAGSPYQGINHTPPAIPGSNAFIAKFALTMPATKLAIVDVNGGSDPTAGAAFNVAVQAQDAIGASQSVVASTPVLLSKHSGSGALGGTLTCMINAGSNGCTVSGVTYSVGEAGVSLTATRTGGDALSAGNSAPFTVNASPIYTVTYDGNLSTGGSVPVDGNLYASGAKVTVLDNTGGLVRTGFTFGNWNTAADGSGAPYAAGATFVMGATNVTLYAHWSPAGSAPLLVGASSRKVHGTAGTFDLPLSLASIHNPTTEPRQGPAHAIVFTFDKPVTGATASVGEGTATMGALSFAGNDVIVPLMGVSDRQYVTVSLTNVDSADGGTGGSASVRIGFLAGDVNGSRLLGVTDLVVVNNQLGKTLTSTNFVCDVNATGVITVLDKVIVNNNLGHFLVAP